MQGAQAELILPKARKAGAGRVAPASLRVVVLSLLACAACLGGPWGWAATAAKSSDASVTAASADVPAPTAASAAASPSVTAPDPAVAPTVSADTLFRRPIVIGASASDGFGVSVRERGAAPGDGVSVSLADILRVAVTSPRTVEGYSSSMAFANPGPILSGEMARAVRQSPTIVIGIDFLFWYVYGTSDATGAPMRSREDRLANLDRGLAQVDVALGRGVPVVIGDIPDMKAAIGKMLSRAQVPDAATLDAVNARIGEWSTTRPGARVFGLRGSVASIAKNGALRAGGTDWSVDDHGPLLLRDELHPSFPGLVALASAVVESAATLLPGESRQAFESSFEFDPMMIRRRLLDERARELGDARTRGAAATAPAQPAGAPDAAPAAAPAGR